MVPCHLLAALGRASRRFHNPGRSHIHPKAAGIVAWAGGLTPGRAVLPAHLSRLRVSCGPDLHVSLP